MQKKSIIVNKDKTKFILYFCVKNQLFKNYKKKRNLMNDNKKEQKP